LTDEASRLLGGKRRIRHHHRRAERVSQNEWIAFIKKRIVDKHAGLTLVTIGRATTTGQGVRRNADALEGLPCLKLMMAFRAGSSGAAEAVQQAGRRDVNVIGLSLPNMNKLRARRRGATVVLWNTRIRIPRRHASDPRHAEPAGAGRTRFRPAAWDRSTCATADHPRRADALQSGQHRSVRFLATKCTKHSTKPHEER
jgi:hypothetical protein